MPSAVSIARQQREIVLRETTQSKAAFLPQSRVLSGAVYNSPNLDHRENFSHVAANGIREYISMFEVTQELDVSGRLRADLSRARANRDVATAGLTVTARDLKRAVASAYFRTLLARHIVRIVGDALQGSRDFENRTRLMFEGGEAARADVVKASAQAAALERSLNAAELDAQTANQSLAAFWTTDVDAPLKLVDVLDGELAPPGGEPGLGEPFLHRPEFSLLEAQRRLFQAERKSARSGMLPHLSLVFQYGIDSPAVRIRDRGYAAYINLNIPVFDWLKARAAVQQARLRERQVEDGSAIAARTYSQEYRNALARVKKLYGQIALARQQASLVGDDLRLSRLRYEGGEGPALDVVVAQNQLADARTGLYSAITNYLNARADLEVAAGR